MIIYIAGKITGDPNYKEKFRQAEKRIKAEFPGAYIFNPAALPLGQSNKWYMDMSRNMISVSDIVVFLPDYTESKGAKLELAYCNYIGVTALLHGEKKKKKEPPRDGNPKSGKPNINKYNLAF